MMNHKIINQILIMWLI